MRDVLICGPVANFLDDVRARCATCGAPCYHRPHVPPGLEIRCVDCFARLYDPETQELVITPETIHELRAIVGPPRGSKH